MECWRLTWRNVLLAMSGLERGSVDDEGFSIRDEYGVVPRSVEKLFTQMEQEQAASTGVTFGVYCSFIEVGEEMFCGSSWNLREELAVIVPLTF